MKQKNKMKVKLQLWLSAILLITINLDVKSQMCFSSPSYYTTSGLGTYNVTNDDFNNDGILDIVALNNSSSKNFKILIGNGMGGFTPATTFTLSNTPAQAVSGDFNGDGKKDLAIAGGANNLWILMGTGTGSFTAATNYNTGIYPGSISKSDFNNDGILDLVVGNGNISNSVSVFLGTGTGSFSAASFFTVGTGPIGFAVSTGDFNNDGKIDIVTANQNSINISLLLGNGAGSFSPCVNFTAGSEPWGIIAKDFNNDGKLDVAVSNRVSNNVSVLMGTGTGSFAPAVNYAVGNAPTSIFSADFNNDGKLDLVTADRYSNVISILLASSSGIFSAIQQFTVSSEPFFVYGGDYNNDGKTDIAVANYGSSNVAVFLSSVPSLSISTTNTTYCSGKSATLTASGATSYTWNPGAITSSSLVISPTTNIIYNLSGSAGSCTNNKSYTISVSPNPTVTAVPSSTAICKGNSATISSGGAISYTLMPGSIVGASAIVSPTTTTTFTVTGINAIGCKNTKTLLIVVNPCTGIDELENKHSIIFYPNPFTNEIYFKTEADILNKKYLIYNTSGQVIQKGILNGNKINCADFSKGLYFIKVEGSPQTFKLVKQN